MTFVFGFRMNLSPHFRFWRSRYAGWFSFLFFSISIRIGRQVHIIKLENFFLSPEESKYREITKLVDPTKRKTLQPGKRPLPNGYREADRIDKYIERKLPPLQPSNKRRPEKEAYELTLENRPFYHKFYGSQLIVGDVVIKSNLDKKMHNLEILPNSQAFIDGKPEAINPTDLMKIKCELIKIQNE